MRKVIIKNLKDKIYFKIQGKKTYKNKMKV